MALTSQLVGIAVTGLLALALAPAKLAMAQGKPQIVVRVEIASKAITDALPSPSAKAAAERTLAVQLSERARARFAFVEWKTVEDPGVPAIGYLVARLAEDTRDAMPAISVHWFAIRPSEAETELELVPSCVN
jgi:hypothetical protein